MNDPYKLRLTTTEAFSVLMEAFEPFPPPHLPAVEEIGVFRNEAGSWCGYLHGYAEQVAGFDIPLFISGTLPDVAGEIPATLVLPGQEIHCLIIQWPGDGKPWKWRALIVAADDTDARDHAVNCMNSGRKFL